MSKKEHKEEELTDEEKAELETQSKLVEEEKKKKLLEKTEQRMYSAEEVMKIVRAEIQKAKDQENGVESLDEEDPYAQKEVRIPRFLKKFIIGFKNTNDDEYNPDSIVHAFDVWNENLKRNEAFVTVIFDDETEMNLPLRTVIEKSQKVWMPLIEIVEKDKSYSSGKTERAEVKDYSRSGTGVMVKMKVTQAEYMYKVKFPDGKERIVGREIINW